MNPIPYGKQYIDKQDEDAVLEALRSDFMTQGPQIAKFERDFAEKVGAKYAVAVSNGTAALHLSLMALGIKPGDKVITTPITFVASANCILYCGAEVVFCDIDAETFTLDLEKLKDILEASPKGTYKAVIPVDFAGYPCDTEMLSHLSAEFGFKIVEDACHAPGGNFLDSKGNTQMCGNGIYSDLTVFSFHPVKHIACGEGGMITTNNLSLYQKLLDLRTHGITKDPTILEENHGGWYYEMRDLGYNYRLTDMQAALGITQLAKLDSSVAKRNIIAQKYDAEFAEANIVTPIRSSIIMHAFHLYVIQIKDRLGLYNHLRKNNIFTQVHYIPVHLQPYYKEKGWKKGDFPIAESYYEKCLSLPMYPTLTEKEQYFVINEILSFYNK
ncbi:MAG: UDP-4-amino-4,6-dideoxy-N-acetyl-beta-L-altrosamine transaminase [Salinivirgaceae bacterium]|jgi:UDP-4-amino-4,6-dideoxy-N-acetyl-beta-L-altrosamine transaminase|nr:UDP-4-amino-4,6-dideoxy-N-acetyl-beta-L-altrosamine transaminase [Salinivirgaceae bacterium]